MFSDQLHFNRLNNIKEIASLDKQVMFSPFDRINRIQTMALCL